MSADIIPLPTTPRSYIAIRRAVRGWRITIETPRDHGPPIATTLASCGDYDLAKSWASREAERIKRPLKLPKVTP